MPKPIKYQYEIKLGTAIECVRIALVASAHAGDQAGIYSLAGLSITLKELISETGLSPDLEIILSGERDPHLTPILEVKGVKIIFDVDALKTES